MCVIPMLDVLSPDLLANILCVAFEDTVTTYDICKNSACFTWLLLNI